jgi:HTH-type transcriptional regulator/antitoxin HigA
MTATYEQLLIETAPAVIETYEQYKRVLDRAADLVGETKRTAEETKLMRLLLLLVKDYDERNAEPSAKSTPAEMLQFLVDQSGKSPVELLSPIFGQDSHVYEALTGKRPISVRHAKMLGERFRVNPSIFLQL